MHIMDNAKPQKCVKCVQKKQRTVYEKCTIFASGAGVGNYDDGVGHFMVALANTQPK